MRFLRFRLRARIFLGYGVLIGLLLGIAAYGSYGLSVVGGEIDRMDGIAGNTNRSQELALRMEVIRRGLAAYRTDQNAETLHEVADAEVRAATLLKEAADYTLSDQRRAMFNGVAAKLGELKAKRDRFAAQLDAGTAEARNLDPAGDALRSEVRRLLNAGEASGAAAEANPASEARVAVVTAEAASLHFLASHDPAWIAIFKKFDDGGRRSAARFWRGQRLPRSDPQPMPQRTLWRRTSRRSTRPPPHWSKPMRSTPLRSGPNWAICNRSPAGVWNDWWRATA